MIDDIELIKIDVKKLFSRKVTIGIYTLADVIEFAVNYLETIGEMLELSIKATATLSDDVIKIDISSDYSPKVIGHNGETLRALNELTRSACFNKFGGHYRILLNCDNYKDEKYPEKEVKIYRYDGTKCLVTIDGKSMSLVKRDLVVDLTEAVNAIVLK